MNIQKDNSTAIAEHIYHAWDNARSNNDIEGLLL